MAKSPSFASFVAVDKIDENHERKNDVAAAVLQRPGSLNGCRSGVAKVQTASEAPVRLQ